MTPRFRGGKNIAMKVPTHQYDDTVRFYRDVLGLEEVAGPNGTDVGFVFGPSRLWIDKAEGMSQAELWLEVVTDDTAAAAEALDTPGVSRRDAIEPLGEMDAFWVASPCSVIHLVAAEAESWD